MRRYLLLLIFVISFCFAASAEARKYALLVGVDEYVNVSSLKCCVNDMKTLKEALLKIGFEEGDIRLLVTGGPYKDLPTKNNIELTFSKIISNAQPSDMIFIAFSGHGAQEGNNVYFCPPDVRTNNLKGTCVSITDAMRILSNKCKAKFKWMVVDACRNDPAQSAKGIGSKGLQTIPPPPAGIALFQSCAAGEESWEDIASGNGYFTKNFAAALSGAADANHDGKLTLLEVCSWTTAHTKEQVKNSQNKSQRPYFSGSVTDFTLSEDLNVPKAKVLVEEARAAMKVKNYPLAIAKYDAAIVLCPKYNSIRREREYVQSLLNAKPQFNSMQISVPGDCKTIEEAYAKAREGGVILIQPGKYELISTIVVNRTVSLRGGTGFAKDVVINCASSDAFKITGDSPSFENITVQSEAENSCCFNIVGGTPKLLRCTIVSTKGNGIYVKGEKSNPIVEACNIKNCGLSGALVIQKGLGEFNDCDIYETKEGCVVVKESGNPTFTKCKFHDGNKAGVLVSDNGLGTFNNCDVYGNSSAGIDLYTLGNPTFTKCKIHDGKRGGVFVTEKALGKFIDCEMYGNAGPGISVLNSGNPTVTDCKFYDNKKFGVYVMGGGLGKFNDCEMYGNAFSGISAQTSGNPTVTGCKIHDNIHEGLFVPNGGRGEFNNCEIYGNAAAGIAIQNSGNPTLTDCKIYNGKREGVWVASNGQGTFTNCEFYKNALPGISIAKSGNLTVTGCKIHDGKSTGVAISSQGMGTFNNNVLEYNYKGDKLTNWEIAPDAGEVKGSGNTPPIPERTK